MTWFKNLKLRVKLLLSFGIVIALVIGLSVFAVTSMQTQDNTYSYVIAFPIENETIMLQFRSAFREMRRATTGMMAYAGDNNMAEVNSYHADALASYSEAVERLDAYDNLVTSNQKMDQGNKDLRLNGSKEIRNYLTEYKSAVLDLVYEMASADDEAGSKDVIHQGAALSLNLREATDYLLKIGEDTANAQNANATVSSNQAITIMIVVAVVCVIIALILALFIASVIQKPVRVLVDIAENVVAGNLNVNIDTSGKDEMGLLAKSFHGVVQSVNNIMNDINAMYKHHDEGEINYHIDTEGYKGAYRDVAVGVDETVHSYVAILDDVFKALEYFGRGDFSYKLKQYKGDKQKANKEMDNFARIISHIVNEIARVAKDGADGNLKTRADAGAFEGEWKSIMNGLNDVLDAVVKPLEEIEAVLTEISRGNFETSVNGIYHGTFAEMKASVNNTVASIAGYIREISDILGKMAGGDLRVSIVREYIGQFSIIKDSINSIVGTLGKTMSEILSASEQVLSGAKQISSSSMTLAEGASEQASAIEELTASIETINSQTQKNAQNAKDATSLSELSTSHAREGNDEMQKMLAAMNQIQDSSNNISRVIKTISEIAFQTNLLALNASVEAARAGEHGRGFAVVAGEVRNLATKSQTSADDTATLIEDSNSRVNDGTKIAETTAESLKLIVDNVAQVSTIITTIAEASREQAEAVSQVSIGLNQISQVVQNNSSTSEESAAAAQELNSQAELLQQMVSYFKI